MKKLMILGAGILQLPAILKAREMGIETVAVDMDPNAVGFAHADTALVISTIDTPNVLKAARGNRCRTLRYHSPAKRETSTVNTKYSTATRAMTIKGRNKRATQLSMGSTISTG